MLEPIDQEGADIVRGVINWPHDFVASQRAEPLGGPSEERIRDFLVVNCLEQAKAADIGAMDRVVFRIVARRDSTHNFTSAAGYEEFGLSVFEEWMLLAV